MSIIVNVVFDCQGRVVQYSHHSDDDPQRNPSPPKGGFVESYWTHDYKAPLDVIKAWAKSDDPDDIMFVQGFRRFLISRGYAPLISDI